LAAYTGVQCELVASRSVTLEWFRMYRAAAAPPAGVCRLGWLQSGVSGPETHTFSPRVVSYTYDNLGRTTKVDYSDSTPDVVSTYDAAGRPRTVTAGAGVDGVQL
jgi:hypothetical protein